MATTPKSSTQIHAQPRVTHPTLPSAMQEIDLLRDRVTAQGPALEEVGELIDYLFTEVKKHWPIPHPTHTNTEEAADEVNDLRMVEETASLADRRASELVNYLYGLIETLETLHEHHG